MYEHIKEELSRKKGESQKRQDGENKKYENSFDQKLQMLFGQLDQHYVWATGIIRRRVFTRADPL